MPSRLREREGEREIYHLWSFKEINEYLSFLTCRSTAGSSTVEKWQDWKAADSVGFKRANFLISSQARRWTSWNRFSSLANRYAFPSLQTYELSTLQCCKLFESKYPVIRIGREGGNVVDEIPILHVDFNRCYEIRRSNILESNFSCVLDDGRVDETKLRIYVYVARTTSVYLSQRLKYYNEGGEGRGSWCTHDKNLNSHVWRWK